MKIVSTSYSKSEDYTNPQEWLHRINFYTGILEELATRHQVISIDRINYEGVLEQKGVRYQFVQLNNKVVYFPRRMHQLIRKLDPDVVLVNGLVFPFQILQLRMVLGKRTKIILLHRGERPFSGVKRWLQKMADNRVDAYLFTSSDFGIQWKENIDTKKIREVVQASSVFMQSDKHIAREKLGLKDERVYLWVGRLDENKDPLTVVKAFKQFLKDSPNANLYMIFQGGDLLSRVQDLVEGENRISLIGKIPHNELQDWYCSADYIVSGSHHEGSGIGLIEAMSCGCIPVVTNIPSFRRMTGPGECGVLYEAGNEKGLLQALIQTKNMDTELESKKALKQFRNELSFSAIAKKIDEVIDSIKREPE